MKLSSLDRAMDAVLDATIMLPKVRELVIKALKAAKRDKARLDFMDRFLEEKKKRTRITFEFNPAESKRSNVRSVIDMGINDDKHINKAMKSDGKHE